MMMVTTKYWWEDVFTGPLAIGINEEKIHQLEDESFLYFKGQSTNEDEENDTNLEMAN
ncbi:hypothetical protein NST62_02890 [Ureibacillus sp. FSL K6-8385]|mgnify:CR=1 FL=1